MTKAILWSGGIDSTYLLYKNLQAGHIVVPYYVDILNNKLKTEAEQQAIKLLSNELSPMFKNFRRVTTIMTVKIYSGEVLQDPPETWLVGLGCVERDDRTDTRR